MNLLWTEPAIEDLNEIAEFIALENPSAAAALVKKVYATVERLRDFPDSGRWLPEASTRRYREVIVPPCRVIYRHDVETVYVIYVMREEQQLRTRRLH